MLLKIKSRIQNISKIFLRFSKFDSTLIKNKKRVIGVLKFLTKTNFLDLLSSIRIKVSFPLECPSTYFSLVIV